MDHLHLTCSICYASVVVYTHDERLNQDALIAHEAWHRTMSNLPAEGT